MPRTEQSETIQRIDAAGRGLFVSCCWEKDRFSHALGIVTGHEHRVLLSSCEGGPEDLWPPSPPLQHILKQTIRDNPALLGVGMAGTGHWSASFVLDASDSIELIVEMAFSGRVTDSSMLKPVLAVTYGPAMSADLQIDADEPDTLRIEPEGCPPVTVSAAGFGRRATSCRFVGERLIVAPLEFEFERATQWKYRIGLA